MNQKILFIGTLIVLVGGYFGASHFYKQQEQTQIQTAIKNQEAELVRDHSPTIGSPMMRATFVEFLDPECEACAFFHPIVKDILKKHEGKIFYVVRYAPFHPNSKFAVALLESARKQGKYWEALDIFFEKLHQWGDHHAPKPELLWGYLEEIGVNTDQVKVDMKDPAIQEIIETDIKDGKAFFVRRTPTFFLNGEQVQNIAPEELNAAIDAAL